MRAKLILLFFILLFVVFGCSRGQEVQDASVQTTSTPIDSEISELDLENADLNDSDLDSLDSDLEAIENL